MIYYIIGFFLAYFILKYKFSDKDRNWNDIIVTFLLSLSSWLYIIMLIMTYITIIVVSFMSAIPTVLKNIKPPKWL